ncbi:DUF1648 domain-containing protein [Dietzia sp. CH92]|uniref:DUF1648 domain-containing protein n=1 Tax=Dietzia sp. CH92 TaxID=3051823 RepID=UPI0028D799AA|nr:DUF1648 domain-containing protein [Dietzia sp. CH92]
MSPKSPATPKRPAAEYVTGPVTRGLRLVSLAAIVAVSAYLLVRYPTLPETVPIHFTFRGEADGFGARSSLLWLAGVMLAMGSLIAWLSTRPRVLNYPGEVTEANAQRLYREGERMMVWVLAGVAVVYLGIVLQTFADAGSAVLVAGLAALMASTLAGLVRMVIAETPN